MQLRMERRELEQEGDRIQELITDTHSHRAKMYHITKQVKNQHLLQDNLWKVQVCRGKKKGNTVVNSIHQAEATANI